MQMQMKYRLPCAASVVHNGSVAIQQIQFARQLCRDELQLAQKGLIFRTGLVQRSKMLTRANQDVRGRLRTDIFKREHFVVLVHDLGRNFLRGNFAEQAVSAHSFLLCQLLHPGAPPSA